MFAVFTAAKLSYHITVLASMLFALTNGRN